MFFTTHMAGFCLLAASVLPMVQPLEAQVPSASHNADKAKPEVRVYDLDHADPNAIVTACRSMGLPVLVSANSRERWLLASGSAEDLDNLEGIIERLERAAARKPPAPEKTALIVKL